MQGVNGQFSLNDFRSILGKQNDGNVVIKEGAEGAKLAKANYGRVFKRGVTPSDPDMNRRIREQLYQALTTDHVVGKTLGLEKLKQITLATFHEDLEQLRTTGRDIDRSRLAQLFDAVDAAAANLDDVIGTENAPAGSTTVMGRFKAKGAYVANDPVSQQAYRYAHRAVTEHPAFTSVENMTKLLSKKAFGFKKSTVANFVKKNFALMRTLSFEALYFLNPEDRPGLKPSTVLLAVMRRITSAYAQHREPTLQVDDLLAPPPARPQDDVTTLYGTTHFGDQLRKLIPTDLAMPNRSGTMQLQHVRDLIEHAFLMKMEHGFISAQENKPEAAKRALTTAFPGFAKLLAADSRLVNDTFAKNFRSALMTTFNEEVRSGAHPERTPEQRLAAIADRLLDTMLTRADIRQAVTDEVLRQMPDAELAEREEATAAILAGLRQDTSREGLRILSGQREAAMGFVNGGEVGGFTVVTGQAENAPVLGGSKDVRDVVRKYVQAHADDNQVRQGLMEKIFATFNVQSVARDLFPQGAEGVPTDLAQLRKIAANVKIYQACVGALKSKGTKFLNRVEVIPLQTGAGKKAENEKLLADLDAYVRAIPTAKLRMIAEYVALLGLDTEYLRGDTKGEQPILKAAYEGLVDLEQLGGFGMGVAADIAYGNDDEDFVGFAPPPNASEADLRALYSLARTIHGSSDDSETVPLGDIRANLNNMSLVAGQQGFGTKDLGAVLKMLKTFGLDLSDINTGKGYLRFAKIQFLVMMHDGRLEGLNTWTERMTGKTLDALTPKDMKKLYDAIRANKAKDPLDKLSADQKKLVDFMQGKFRISELGLANNPQEVRGLVTSLQRMVRGEAENCSATLGGLQLTMKRGWDGLLVASLNVGGKYLPFTASRSPEEFLAQFENEITTQAPSYPKETVMAVLPTNLEAHSLARVRELCIKTLTATLGLPSVRFASMSTEDLMTRARAALDGTYTAANVPEEAPTTYNSAEMIEVHERFMQAEEADLAKVTMPEQAPGRTQEQREALPPEPQTFKNLLGDLLLNKDTWTFDLAAEQDGGARLKRVLQSYEPELRHLTADDAAMDHAVAELPEAARAGAKELLKAVKGLVEGGLDTVSEQALQTLGEKTETFMTTLVPALQTKITALFVAHEGGDNVPTWKKSFSEVNGSEGLDTSTAQGRFLKTVLDSYLTNAKPIEKRAMLAAFLRNTGKDDTDGKLVAELLKGAGPLLQKMLQGLPMETFSAETQIALKDMKSKLAPIPEEAVMAQMLELVRSSNGNIHTIQVVKSLGAATVGQAFLCHITTKEHPLEGEDVVIKLLRPNVSTAIQREYAQFRQIAEAQGGGMAEMLKNQYEGILKELDFTLEAENIDLGYQAYERPSVLDTDDDNKPLRIVQENVRSMTRNHNVPPTTGALVLTRVKGETYDHFLTEVTDDLKAVRKAHTQELRLDDEVVRPYEGQTLADVRNVRGHLLGKRNAVVRRFNTAARFVKAWTENALFGNGFFHGDLHAGNVMTDEDTLTVIDYGNAMRLSPEQQKNLNVVLLTCVVADTDVFLTKIGDMLAEGEKAKLEQLKGNEAFLSDVRNTLAKGSGMDVTQRLTAVASVLQRYGIALPGEVNAFLQSLSRLQSVVKGLEESLHALDEGMNAIVLKAEMQEHFNAYAENEAILETQLPGLKVLDEAILAYCGETRGPDVEKLVALKEGTARVLDGFQPLKDRFATAPVNAAFCEEAKNVLAAIRSRYGTRETFARYVRLTDAGDVNAMSSWPDQEDFDALEQLLNRDASTLTEAQVAELRQKLTEFLTTLSNNVFNFIDDLRSSAENIEPFDDVTTFEDLVSDVIYNHRQQIFGELLKTYGFAGGITLKNKQSAMDALKEELAEAVRQANAANARLPAQERLSLDVRQKIAAVAKEFRRPVTGGTSDLKEDKKLPDTAEGLREVLIANITALKAALGDAWQKDTATYEQVVKYFVAIADTALRGNLKAALKKHANELFAWSQQHHNEYPILGDFLRIAG